MKSKIGMSTAFVVALATALSGCAEDPTDDPLHKDRQQPRQTWALDVERDECGVSAIVQEYYETGASQNGRSYGGDFFRQDQDSLLRTRYRGRDWNLLDYITKDDRFQLQPECRSDFSRTEIYNGVRNNNKIEYYFRAGSGANSLCRVSPVRYRLDEAGGRALQTGQVLSCINVETGSKTFDVIRNN